MGAQIGRTEFRRFVEANAGLDVTCADAGRRSRLRAILGRTQALLDRDPGTVLAAVPRIAGKSMEPCGWAWNGFYVLGDDGALHLGHAYGPPVCSPLGCKGGLFTSGMGFDCLAANQTLAAYDVDRWPGYVSCDAASGLATRAGIACPIRDPEGRPIAVWDLDATRTVEPADVRFADVFFATLSRVLAIGPDDLR